MTHKGQIQTWPKRAEFWVWAKGFICSLVNRLLLVSAAILSGPLG